MYKLTVHFYNPKNDKDGVWNKIVSYVDPPYCHCEIEFFNGLSCAVYLNGPVHMKTRTPNYRPLGIYSINCTLCNKTIKPVPAVQAAPAHSPPQQSSSLPDFQLKLISS